MIKNVAAKKRDEQINKTFSENSLKMMRKRYLATDDMGRQETPADMFHRVARAIAAVEKDYKRDAKFIKKVEEDFFSIMSTKEFTPAGRTLTNAGAGTALIANCIVLPIHDTMESIFQTLKDAAILQQAGAGLGFSLDELRPAMFPTKRSRGFSSGSVEFLKIYNQAFGTIKQQGRHGANMAMISVDHPDFLDFIRSKEAEGELKNFNISIKVTDEFMRLASQAPETPWFCTWKEKKIKPRKILRHPNGSVYGYEELDMTVGDVMGEIVNYAWKNGEPGIVFIDTINKVNPLPGLGRIECSNPCGEQFLHAYDNCNLGSVNLAVFVKNGQMDWARLKFVTRTSVRMLDNVIDRFDFPVPQVTDLAKKNRRIGLGIMGFADMLYQLGIKYNSAEGIAMAEKTMAFLNKAAHEMSQELAKEKGVFPNYNLSVFAKKKVKMRNAALTTVAPTGSISMMYDTSSGCEPNFALAYIKQDKDGVQYQYLNSHFEKELKKRKFDGATVAKIKEELIKTGSIQHLDYLPKDLRDTFVISMEMSGIDHVRMQGAFQKNVDNSISKTVNFPNSATHEDVRQAYIEAWKAGCKSSTVYRDGSRNVQILNLGTGENIISTTSDPKKLAKIESMKSIDLAVDMNRLEPRKRPETLSGKTYKVKTGYGNLYVTVNNDEIGVPFEVFATIGKSGGFFQEQSEAICRLISLSLRSGIKVEEIIDDLKGIRGPMPTLTARGTVLSLPDAIGRILEEHARNGEQTGLFAGTMVEANVGQVEAPSASAVADPMAGKKISLANYGHPVGCPDCGERLTMAEGCISCKSCGFSRCT